MSFIATRLYDPEGVDLFVLLTSVNHITYYIVGTQEMLIGLDG